MSRCLWRSSANVYLFRTIGDIVVKHQTVFEASSTKIRRRREINWYISHTARTRTPFPLYSALIKMLRILLFNFIAYTRETISKPAVSSVRGSKRSEIEKKKGGIEVCTYQWNKSQRSRHWDSHLYCYKWHGSQFASDPIAGGIQQTRKDLSLFSPSFRSTLRLFSLFFLRLEASLDTEKRWSRSKFQYIGYQILVEIQSAICR